MSRLATLGALALLGAAALSPLPADAGPSLPGIAAPAGPVTQAGGRWDDRPGAHRGWGYNYGDGRGYRGYEPPRWGPPPHRHWGWAPPPPPRWAPPPHRHWGWAPPPPPRYYRPGAEFSFRF